MTEIIDTTHSECVAPKKKRKDTTLRKIAKRVGVSENSLRKISKIKQLAEIDSDMQKIADQCSLGELSIKKAYDSYKEICSNYDYVLENFELVKKTVSKKELVEIAVQLELYIKVKNKKIGDK